MLAPLAALRSMERREVVRDGQRGGTRFVVADPVGSNVDTARRSYAVDLAERGVAYRWLVSSKPGADGRAPSLAPRGWRCCGGSMRRARCRLLVGSVAPGTSVLAGLSTRSRWLVRGRKESGRGPESG